MNTLLRLFLILALSSALQVGAAPAGDDRHIDSEVSKIDARRVEALLKADLKALDQIYADNMVYVHSAGKIDTKKGYLASLASGNLVYVSISYQPPAKVLVAGSNTAVVTGTASLEVKNKAGKSTQRKLTTTTVYARTAAGWQAVSYQATPFTP